MGKIDAPAAAAFDSFLYSLYFSSKLKAVRKMEKAGKKRGTDRRLFSDVLD